MNSFNVKLVFADLSQSVVVMSLMLAILVTLLSVFGTNECSNILAVFPIPSISHQIVFRPITQELAKRGHSVTVVTPDPIFKDKTFSNLTEIDIHDASYHLKDELIFEIAATKDTIKQMDIAFRLFTKNFEAQLQVEGFKKLLNDKSKKFDVIIAEACIHNVLAISHVFKAPVVLISSFGTFTPNNFIFGSSSHPVFYPTSLYHKKCHNHTIWDRLEALYSQFMVNWLFEKYEKEDNIMLKKYFPDIPNLSELRNNVELLMLNVHSFWENNRPVPSNVIYLGGLPQRPHKQLPKSVVVMSLMLAILTLLSVFGTNECSNILAVFPIPSISHQLVFRPITQELAKRGHSVTVVTTDPIFKDKTFPNLTEIDVHDASYQFIDEVFEIAKTNDIIEQTDIIFRLLTKYFEAQLQVEDFKKLLNDKSKKFDVIITEACIHNVLAISHVFKAPVILISSFGTFTPNNFVFGSSSHPVFYPMSFYHKKNHNHTIWDRLEALYSQFMVNWLFEKYENVDNTMLKKYFPDIPNLSELRNNVELLMLNVHPIWENNRPVPPNVIYLGGIPQQPQKQLPMDLQTYLDSSKHGVIYMSFGTNVNPSLLSPEKVQTILKVFSKLPYDVLWKWDKIELEGRPDNVRLGKWFPQSDLLRHPKVKLFITQGGLQSTDETIQGGVPVIGIPMLGDQWYNVDQYVRLGIGKHIEFDDIEEDNFMDAIRTVIEDGSYKKNIIELRSTMYDQPNTALERAVYWTEYVIKHKGARHLRAAGANLPWTVYYQIDIVLILLGCMFGGILIIGILLYYLLKFVPIFNSKMKKE